MLTFKFTGLGNIKENLNNLPGRLENLRSAIGNTIADTVKRDVVSRIPDEPGWFRIYKRAIEVKRDTSGEWSVAGESNISIHSVDADKTLIFFSGGDKASSVLAYYNPWPIDIVPAIDAIYSSKILIKPASIGEVSTRRGKLTPQMDKVKDKLAAAGFKSTEGELPKFGSETVADLGYLAKRLEYGLGGFPRIPIWNATASNISANIKKAVKAVNTDKFLSILRGGHDKEPAKPSTSLRSMLAAAVRKTPV